MKARSAKKERRRRQGDNEKKGKRGEGKKQKKKRLAVLLWLRQPCLSSVPISSPSLLGPSLVSIHVLVVTRHSVNLGHLQHKFVVLFASALVTSDARNSSGPCDSQILFILAAPLKVPGGNRVGKWKLGTGTEPCRNRVGRSRVGNRVGAGFLTTACQRFASDYCDLRAPPDPLLTTTRTLMDNTAIWRTLRQRAGSSLQQQHVNSAQQGHPSG